MPTNPADLRQTYRRADLTEAEALDDPMAQFRRWFDDALASGTHEPNAMTLATVDGQGQPSARIVLLKGIEPDGFVFYTNYDSRKGQELDAQGRAALVFWWPPLERQVRVEGRVERVDAAESDAYFARRPHGSQLGALATPQSQPVPDRAALEQRLRDLEARFPEGTSVPRPAHWGGYCVVPTAVEFWQGRPNRLHDRLRYTRHGDAWTRERLAP